MKIAICDDNAQDREKYADYVSLIAKNAMMDCDVVTYSGAEKLLFSLRDRKDPPDIVLLDILMPTMDGISLGAKMRDGGYTGMIIYLSRSDEYMLPAFDVDAFNYVVKADGVIDERFEQVFLKAVEALRRRKRKCILINGISEHRNIQIDSIDYFEVEKHVIKVHYGNDEVFAFSSTLGRMEELLAPYGFARIHRSFLVRCAAVESFTRDEVVMSGGRTFPLGRKYLGAFREAMAVGADVSFGEAK